jgi:hypothetical protein
MTDWYKKYRNKKEYLYINNPCDEEDSFYVKFAIPESLGSLDEFELDKLSLPKCYRLMTEKDIKEYFDVLDEARFEIINYYNVNFGCYSECSYCYNCFTDGNSYYCTKCNKDLCCKCYQKFIENGTVKSSRRDCKGTCLPDHKFIIKTVEDFSCCKCGKKNKHVLKTELWYRDREKKINICQSCRNEEEKEKIEEVQRIYDQSGFGSMLDWVPVIQEELYVPNRVLLNLNKNSDLYGQTAFEVMDSHGREGFYVYGKNIRDTVDDLKTADEELEGLYNMTPIDVVCERMGLQIDFG